MLKPYSGRIRQSNLVLRKPSVCLIAAIFLASVVFAGPALQDYALILQDEPVATRIHSRSELQSAPARQHMQTIATAHGSQLAYSDASDGGAVFTYSLAISTPKPDDG